MKVQLPFSYSLGVKLKANKNVVPRRLHDFVERDIPEITAGEAPVAVKWRESGYRSHGAPFRRVPARVRYYDGEFYVPATESRLDGADAFTADMLPGHPRRNTDYDGSLPMAFSRNWGRMGMPILDAIRSYVLTTSVGGTWTGIAASSVERGAEVISSDRDDCHSFSEAIIGSLLIVDDGVWRKCAEPVLMVHERDVSGHEAGQRHGVFGVCCELPTFGARINVSHSGHTVLGTERTRFFRMDRFDEALESLGEAISGSGSPVTNGRGGFDSFTSTVDEITVPMPGQLTFDAEANGIAREIGRCLALAGRLQFKDAEARREFLRVEDLYTAYFQTGDLTALAEAAASIPGLFDATGGLNKDHRAALATLRSLDDTMPISIDQRSFAP